MLTAVEKSLRLRLKTKGDSFKSSQIQKNLLRCVFVWAVLWPANVMRMSQFSVGTVFIQDLWDMMCLPACSSRFPNNLSEREREEGERRGGERGRKVWVTFSKLHKAMTFLTFLTMTSPNLILLLPQQTHTHSYIQLFFNSYPVYRLNRTFPLMLMLVPESVIDLS